MGRIEGSGNRKSGDWKKKEMVVRGERRQKGNSKGVRVYCREAKRGRRKRLSARAEN